MALPFVPSLFSVEMGLEPVVEIFVVESFRCSRFDMRFRQFVFLVVAIQGDPLFGRQERIF